MAIRVNQKNWVPFRGFEAHGPSQKLRPRATTLASLLGCLFLVACRAKPAPDAGFLDQPKLMAADANGPFNRIYRNPKFQAKRFAELFVAPVNINHLMAQNLWEKGTLATMNPQDVRKNIEFLAEYQRLAFIKAAKDDPQKHFRIVDRPGPSTLILEVAIVQLVPSKPELQAASYVPGAGLIATGVMVAGSTLTQSEDQGKGVIAMEGRTRDGETGETVWMFADREHPPMAIVDFKALTWWEPAKPICDAWARQFVQLQNAKPGVNVKGKSSFELLVPP